jgi:hypothetical protein
MSVPPPPEGEGEERAAAADLTFEPFCQLTQEELLGKKSRKHDKLEIDHECPICLCYGIRCLIAYHPLQPGSAINLYSPSNVVLYIALIY